MDVMKIQKNESRTELAVSLVFITILFGAAFIIDTIAPRGFLSWFLYLAILFYVSLKLSKYFIIFFLFLSITLTVWGYFLSPPGIAAELALINRCVGILVLWMAGTLLFYQSKEKESKEEIEQLFKVVLDKAACGIAFLDTDGFINSSNKMFGQILGYDSKKLMGKNIQDLTHPNYIKEFNDVKEKIFFGLLKSDFLEEKLIKQDGNSIRVNLTLSIIQNNRGKPKSFIASIEDLETGKNVIERKPFAENKEPLTHFRLY
jgi:PAS domain S-box-containing protein